MSDFLSRVLARSQGQAPVLQRRRASLFEPQPAVAQVEAPASRPTSPQPAPSAPLSREPAAVMERAPIQPFPVAVRAPAELDATPVSRSESPVRSREQPREPAEERGTVLVEVGLGPPVAAPVARPMAPSFEASVAPPVVTPGAPLARPSAPAPAVTPPVRRRAGVPRPGSETIPRAGSEAVAPAPIEAPALVEAPRPTVVTPLPRPTLSSARGLTRRPAAPVMTSAPPAPAIQVTIGRIEVRAVQSPSAPARRQGPAGPRLSLEEYLKSRAGGGG